MNNALPPPAMLMHLVAGKFVTQALAAAAELSVAEQLVDGPKTAQEIAETTKLHAPSLYRLMRASANLTSAESAFPLMYKLVKLVACCRLGFVNASESLLQSSLLLWARISRGRSWWQRLLMPEALEFCKRNCARLRY